MVRQSDKEVAVIKNEAGLCGVQRGGSSGRGREQNSQISL